MTTLKRPKPKPVAPGLIVPSGRELADIADEVENQDRKYLEPPELAALWASLAHDAFWHGYFRLQYHFGCRCSEVALILKEEISVESGTVIIRRLKKREDKKKGKHVGGFKRRRYQFPPSLGSVLAAAAALVPVDNPWFFGSRRMGDEEMRASRMAALRITKGGWRSISRSAAQRRFVRAAEEAGIREHLRHTHVLRHTRATVLFANGVSETQVQIILDHSSPAQTRNYIHWANDLKQRTDVITMLSAEDSPLVQSDDYVDEKEAA